MFRKQLKDEGTERKRDRRNFIRHLNNGLVLKKDNGLVPLGKTNDILLQDNVELTTRKQTSAVVRY